MKTFTLLGMTALVATCVSLPASADCSAPTNPGAVICFPSTNATVVYPMIVEGAATGRNGLPIVQMILYANNHKVNDVLNANTLTFADTANNYNGSYHLVL